MGRMREKKGVKTDTTIFGLSNWRSRIVIYWNKKDWEDPELGFGYGKFTC